MRLVKLCFMVVMCLGLLACPANQNYFIKSSTGNTKQLKELFSMLEPSSLQNPDEKYAVIQKISASFIEYKNYSALIHFLSETVANDPEGKFNAKYLLAIALAYSQNGAHPIAAIYYDRILKNYNDLIINGESIHLACLHRLIALSSEPATRIELRRELIYRFPDKIDIGTVWFMLGQDYEAMGDWDAAIDAYRRFLPSFSNEIPNHPDARQYAQLFINLASIRKDWTFETLDELLKAVSIAMQNSDSYALSRLRAKVGFFAMDWYQDRAAGNSQVLFDFSAFTAGARIQRADKLDPSSNSNEAFLRTWGWSERITIWYLYFRKINFPADPEIHGRWEWAGIYFGEKIQ